jgi:hypothetical protein
MSFKFMRLIDGHTTVVMATLWAARLAWDIPWALFFKMLPIRTPTALKYSDYGGLTAGSFSPSV